MSNAHTMFEVARVAGAAEMILPAKTELYVVAFGAGTEVTPDPDDDKVPGLYGDFAPTATDGGETTVLADRSSVYTPGEVTFDEKTLTMKVTGSHPKVLELWAHAGTNDESATAGKSMAYNNMHADRSGWRGVLQVKTMNIPTEGSFEHQFVIQHLNRIYIPVADNPVPVVTP